MNAGLISSALRMAAGLCLAVGLSLALPATALDVPGESTLISWPASSGPVAGYYVMVYRNGSSVPELPLPSTHRDVRLFAVRGKVGDRVRVQVAAFDAKGNVGPPSARSSRIVFVGVGATPPDPGGSGGSPPPEVPSGPLPGCADPMLVIGKDRVAIHKGRKERGTAAMRSVLCDGQWTGFAAGSVLWGGRFERAGDKGSKARKLRLDPDAPTIEAILASLDERIALLAGRPWRVSLRGEPKLIVKANRGRDRVKWTLDMKLDLTHPKTGKVQRGSYQFDLSGSLSPALAEALWP